jgi:hypothetical protein
MKGQVRIPGIEAHDVTITLPNRAARQNRKTSRRADKSSRRHEMRHTAPLKDIARVAMPQGIEDRRDTLALAASPF